MKSRGLNTFPNQLLNNGMSQCKLCMAIVTSQIILIAARVLAHQAFFDEC
jgi:hypothetical protein